MTTFVLASVLLCSSCIGSFGLTGKVLSWNKGLCKSKFLNELVFILISPAYAVCGVADLFIFNTVEFWSGNSLLAKNVGKTQKVMGSDGKYYAVKNLEDGYEITCPDGRSLRLVYDKDAKSWSRLDNEGEIKELFRFNEDGTLNVTLPTGEKLDVAANDAGLCSVRQAMNGGMFWAFR